MAVACPAMEVHDRRLSISKASASKISKPSPVLKNLSASSSSPSSSSSSPPSQPLPSSITSSPSRPIAKVVNADPSSFRRVVQELTGTTLPSTSSPSNSGPPLRGLSRLQRIAPPPLRSGVRTLQDPHHHHQSLLEQMQHQQQASQMRMFQQNIPPKVGALSPPVAFMNELGSCNPNPISDPITQLGNPNPNSNCTPSLPMLSPHLLSPLPALTPGDNTWANPIDVISHSPKPVISTTSNLLPPLLPSPNLSTGNLNNGLLMKPPVHALSNGYGDVVLTKPYGGDVMYTKPAPFISNAMFPATHGGGLPPLLATPPSPWLVMPHTSNTNVLPPWSPSPIPFSPGLFPPSPGPGPPAPMAAMPHVNDANLYFNGKYGTMNPNMPNNFTF